VTGRAYQLYCHTINENHPEGTDDLLLYEEPDERFVLKINLSNNKKYFLLHIEGQITKEVRYCPTNQPKLGFQPVSLK
jgi:protease II